MKLSSILSFAALSATTAAAFPLSPFRGLRARAEAEERDVYAPAPVRRSEVAFSAVPSATESSVESTATATATATETSTTDTASATSTAAADETTATSSESTSSTTDDSTNTWIYSTITQSGAMTTPPASTRTLDPTTETASTTTETEAPQSTDVSRNDQNNSNNNVNVDISQQVVIRIKEVIRIREVIVVERPVLVAVQVNLNVRKTIIVNQIRNVFITRFDNWDQNVIDELGFIVARQFDILSRSRNRGFDNLSNDQYNQFVSKFISQFQVFQNFQLVDVQQLVTVLKGFGVNQLATFFGRSDALFSQDTFNRFNVNNDFRVFVQQLTVIVQSVSTNAFNSDDLFGFGGSGSLIAAGSIPI